MPSIGNTIIHNKLAIMNIIACGTTLTDSITAVMAGFTTVCRLPLVLIHSVIPKYSKINKKIAEI